MSFRKAYAVFGLGRYGFAVAKELQESGVEVLAVDVDAERINDAAMTLPVCKCADVTDPEVIRKEIEETVKLCFKYGCPCDIVLKDISNVSHRPENLIVWSQVVSDVLDEYYGAE